VPQCNHGLEVYKTPVTLTAGSEPAVTASVSLVRDVSEPLVDAVVVPSDVWCTRRSNTINAPTHIIIIIWQRCQCMQAQRAHKHRNGFGMLVNEP